MFTFKKTVIPHVEFNQLTAIKTYNSDYNIPSNYELYLELTYGKNWRKPDKNYSKEKWERNNKSIIKYQIKDRNVKKPWVERYNKAK